MRLSGAKKKWNVKMIVKDDLENQELVIGQLWECADYFLFSPKMLWDWCKAQVEDQRKDILDAIKLQYQYRLRRDEGITGQMVFSLSPVDLVF
jgi:hypothetical protein